MIIPGFRSRLFLLLILQTTVPHNADGKVLNSIQARRPASPFFYHKLSGERLKTNTAVAAAISSSAHPGFKALSFLKKNCAYFFILGCILYVPIRMYAQKADTLKTVELFSKKPFDISSSPVSAQQLNKNDLSRINSFSVADAVKYFPGVVVKDYGGIGGLKTISVRSLGANHTGIMYDGIMIADAQGGQIDLGKFSLDNIDGIQLFSNQPPDILLPARSYASSSVIAISSSAMSNNQPNKISLDIRCKAGSFGLIDPSVYFKIKPSKHFSTALNAEYQSANGKYSFVDYETGQSKSKRTNSGIKSYRVEYDAAYEVNDSNRILFKAYYYNSKRGLPGTVILYNNTSDERLDNESYFGQLSWKYAISKKSRLLLNGKYSVDNKFYLDPSYANSAGKLENDFHQKELYASAAYSYNIIPSLAVSYAIDYFRSSLKRTDSFALKFANPVRNSLLNNIALRWQTQRLEVNANLLYTSITEKVETGPVADSLNKFTPAFAVSVQPFKNVPVRLRASYKNIFRATTFDDLYYTNIGNTKLRPEYAKQYNVGFTVSKQSAGITRSVIFTSDFYYNKVTDKILAVPRQNLFQWTMLNIGEVDIHGLDASLYVMLKQWKEIEFSTRFSYGFQKALDVSDPSSALYKLQLPYTPRHSGSANINIKYRSLLFSYNIISSSNRYRLGDQIPDNLVKGWTTHDVSLTWSLSPKGNWNYKLIAEANNVYNLQYEVIKYYPMPRFNYRVGIVASFKK